MVTDTPIEEVAVTVTTESTCITEKCSRLTASGEDRCAACEILFGPYEQVLHRHGVQEWVPPEPERPEVKEPTQAELSAQADAP